MTANQLKEHLKKELSRGIDHCFRAFEGKLRPDCKLIEDLALLQMRYKQVNKDRNLGGINYADDVEPVRTQIFQGLQTLIFDISPADLLETAPDDLLANWPLPDNLDFPDVPFLGFHRFQTHHARVFYGRKKDIRTVLDLLEAHPDKILLLNGPTGAGKSSLIEAGLLPRLHHRGWAVEVLRRNRERGLVRDMHTGRNALQATGAPYKLLLLDQVEEMFTNPNEALPFESREWAEALQEAWYSPDGFGCRLLISFRKEYLSDIIKLMEDVCELPFKSLYIEPPSHFGVREAVAGDAERNTQYGLTIYEHLPQLIARNLCPQPEHRPNDPGVISPGTAPLLQMTLRKMWDLACNGQPRPSVPFDQRLYEQVSKRNLSEMLDQQLLELEQHFSPDPAAPAPPMGKQSHQALHTAVQNGLALDVLRQFITKELTATTKSVAKLETEYYRHVPDFRRLIKALKDLFLLGEEAEEQQTRTRLTHDALAPLINQRCETSDKAAQLAWYLVNVKSRHVAPTEGADFSEVDLAIIEAGRPYMESIPDAIDRRIQASNALVEARRAELRDKNARMFDTVAAEVVARLARCEHLAALDALKNAVLNGEVPSAHKQERLQHAICETAFFFSQTGKHTSQTLEALQLLTHLPQTASLTTALEQTIHNGHTDAHAVKQLLLLVDEDWYTQTLIPRYFPVLIHVPEGAFTMGSEDGYADEKPTHAVTLNAFRLGETPVTFYQFSLYCAAEGRNIASFRPSWGIHGESPAVNISWYDAVEYAIWLSSQMGLNPYYRIDKQQKDPHNKSDTDYRKWLVETMPHANGFRLPTEAEWEYAARGGASGQADAFPYAGSKEINEVGWFWQNSGDAWIDGEDRDWDMERINQNNGRTHPVRDKNPNQLFLYDMSGNVWEWCADWFGDYPEEPVNDPTGPEGGSTRVLRGGSWINRAGLCRVSYRNYSDPGARSYNVGFRVAASPQ